MRAMSPSVFRHCPGLVVALFVPFLAGACSDWQPADAGAGVGSSGADVRVHLVDGTWLALRGVELRGDSIFGEDPSCRWKPALGAAPGRSWCAGVAIARADVASVHVRVPAPYRTNVAILAFGLGWCALMIACLEAFSGACPRGAGGNEERRGRVGRALRGSPGIG
jgi:hypothetical protein